MSNPSTVTIATNDPLAVIETHYLGASNFRPARIVAVCKARRMVASYDDGLSPSDNHRNLADILANAMGWYGHYAIGSTKRGYVFVNTNGRGA